MLFGMQKRRFFCQSNACFMNVVIQLRLGTSIRCLCNVGEILQVFQCRHSIQTGVEMQVEMIVIYLPSYVQPCTQPRKCERCAVLVVMHRQSNLSSGEAYFLTLFLFLLLFLFLFLFYYYFQCQQHHLHYASLYEEGHCSSQSHL